MATSIALHGVMKISMSRKSYKENDHHPAFCVIDLNFSGKDGDTFLQVFSDDPVEIVEQEKEATNG